LMENSSQRMNWNQIMTFGNLSLGVETS